MLENFGLLIILVYLPFVFYIFHLQEKSNERLDELYDKKLRDVLYRKNEIILPEESEIRKEYKVKESYLRIQLISLFILSLFSLLLFSVLLLISIVLFLLLIFCIKKTMNRPLRPNKIIIKNNQFTLETDNIIRSFNMDELEDIRLDFRNLISFNTKETNNKKRVKITHEKAWYLFEYINQYEVVW